MHFCNSKWTAYNINPINLYYIRKKLPLIINFQISSLHQFYTKKNFFIKKNQSVERYTLCTINRCPFPANANLVIGSKSNSNYLFKNTPLTTDCVIYILDESTSTHTQSHTHARLQPTMCDLLRSSFSVHTVISWSALSFIGIACVIHRNIALSYIKNGGSIVHSFVAALRRPYCVCCGKYFKTKIWI